ncbi:MAG: ribonuclease R [Gammaproteobacteria bacterium]
MSMRKKTTSGKSGPARQGKPGSGKRGKSRSGQDNKRRANKAPVQSLPQFPPEQQQIIECLQQAAEPCSLEKLTALLEFDEAAAAQLEKNLHGLEAQGVILRNRRGDFGLADKMNLIRGRVIGHADGFGFLVPDQGGDDLFMSPREMRSLLHGDRALVSVSGIDSRGRRLGSVVEVLERANTRVVGRYSIEHGVGVVLPDNRRINQDILIPPDLSAGAKDGQFVVAEITAQPDKKRQPLGRIEKILGDQLAPGMAVDIAIHAFNLPNEWPAAVEQETRAIPDKVLPAELADRVDLRGKPLVTIDSEDARDYDDAICCERDGKGWRLWVAIADVSHYVQPGSALDNEARIRGNSVYFPGLVIPMLPESLSNEICSLKPQVDRLCMVCEMTIDAKGNVNHSEFYPAVMHSAARLTYTEVASVVGDGERPLSESKQAVIPQLRDLYALYQLLHQRRGQNGVLEFGSTETKLVFNEQGQVVDVQVVERNDAHRMIEEFMLAANVSTGKFLEANKMPTLYRTHESPAEEKLEALRKLLGEMGLKLGGGEEPTARDYARVIEQIQGRDNAHMIETVLLRSMRLAMYSADNVGHFGLNFPVYAHFTSPIRRFPDLLVHRAIRHVAAGGHADTFLYSYAEMQALGEHCSMAGRRADDATRDAITRYKCEFMRDRVGEVFDGIIIGVTSFGIFVEMADVFVEGLVHISALGRDYFQFDPVGHRLRGERSGEVYRLADRVRVQVVRVDLDERKIDLELAD